MVAESFICEIVCVFNRSVHGGGAVSSSFSDVTHNKASGETTSAENAPLGQGGGGGGGGEESKAPSSDSTVPDGSGGAGAEGAGEGDGSSSIGGAGGGGGTSEPVGVNLWKRAVVAIGFARESGAANDEVRLHGSGFFIDTKRPLIFTCAHVSKPITGPGGVIVVGFGSDPIVWCYEIANGGVLLETNLPDDDPSGLDFAVLQPSISRRKEFPIEKGFFDASTKREWGVGGMMVT